MDNHMYYLGHDMVFCVCLDSKEVTTIFTKVHKEVGGGHLLINIIIMKILDAHMVLVTHLSQIYHAFLQILVNTISSKLVYVGWAIIVSRTKKRSQIAILLEVDSKLEYSKNKHFTSCNVSKCPYGYQDIKNKILKKSLNFFQCLLEILCPFNLFFQSLCLSNFIHM